MEFIDLKAQYKILKDTLQPRISKALDDANFIMGPEVGTLENRLSQYLKIKHSITCANGTDSLMLALMALNLKAGEVVLVPSFTFAASAEAIAFLHGVPFFLDVSKKTFNVDIESIENGYNDTVKAGLKPVGIMTVDLFGLSCEYDVIQEFCKAKGLWHIIDAAQAFGAKYKNKFNSEYADITTTSFFPAKPLGCYGDGGAVFTNSDELSEKIKSLRVHGKGKDKYDNIHIGMNSRLDTIQAVVLDEKLNVYDREVIRRNEIANMYNELLSSISNLHTPEYGKEYLSVWAQYTIRSSSRDKIQSTLKLEGIPSMIYYAKPLHMQTAYNNFPKMTSMRNSEILSEEVLSLPMHPYLSDEEINKITKSMTK